MINDPDWPIMTFYWEVLKISKLVEVCTLRVHVYQCHDCFVSNLSSKICVCLIVYMRDSNFRNMSFVNVNLREE